MGTEGYYGDRQQQRQTNGESVRIRQSLGVELGGSHGGGDHQVVDIPLHKRSFDSGHSGRSGTGSESGYSGGRPASSPASSSCRLIGTAAEGTAGAAAAAGATSVGGLGLKGGNGGDAVLDLGVMLKAMPLDLEGNQGLVGGGGGKSVDGVVVGVCMPPSEAGSAKKQKVSMGRKQLRKIKALLTRRRAEEREGPVKSVGNDHLQGLSGEASCSVWK